MFWCHCLLFSRRIGTAGGLTICCAMFCLDVCTLYATAWGVVKYSVGSIPWTGNLLIGVEPPRQLG
jgi:hypothetical protein